MNYRTESYTGLIIRFIHILTVINEMQNPVAGNLETKLKQWRIPSEARFVLKPLFKITKHRYDAL
jgi:hypothetical protein